MATRKQINDRVVALVKAAVMIEANAGVKVYPRIRYPYNYRDDEYAALVCDDNNSVNVHMIVTSSLPSPQFTEAGQLDSRSFGIRLLSHRAVKDDDDDALCSDTFFQADNDAIDAALLAPNPRDDRLDLGLGPAVTITGYQGQITTGRLGVPLCHIRDSLLTVRIAGDDCD